MFGHALAMLPLLRNGYRFGTAVRIAFLLRLAIPGAMDAPLDSLLFWRSLAFALGGLGVAGVVAFPLNRWLIARGRGHAITHRHH